MKKYFFRFCSICLILCTVLSISASAVAPRASEQIDNYSMDVIQKRNGELEIRFSVQGTNIMDRIGASSIAIYKQSGTTWTKVTSYNQDDPGMSASDHFKYSNSIYFNGVIGTQYQIVITIFAKDSSGADSKTQTFYAKAIA